MTLLSQTKPTNGLLESDEKREKEEEEEEEEEGKVVVVEEKKTREEKFQGNRVKRISRHHYFLLSFLSPLNLFSLEGSGPRGNDGL